MRPPAEVSAYLVALARSGASASLLRQRKWALARLVVAAGATGPSPALVDVVSPEAISSACDGLASPWSRRAVVAAAREISAANGLAPSSHSERAALQHVLSGDDLVRATGVLSEGTDPMGTRLALIIELMRAAELRAGDLAELQVVDVAWDGAPEGQLSAARVVLPARCRTLLGAWLRVRADLVSRLQGSDHGYLLVTFQSSHTHPAGMPLRPRGVQRTYAAAVAHANERHLDDPRWTPIPSRLDLLRRSLHPR